jgi:hypothetical protein
VSVVFWKMGGGRETVCGNGGKEREELGLEGGRGGGIATKAGENGLLDVTEANAVDSTGSDVRHFLERERVADRR